MRHGAPHATITPAQVAASTTVVPVSGCSSTGAVSTPNSTALTASAAGVGRRAAAYEASASTSESFAASEGWIVDPPTGSQRRAPYSEEPAASTMSSKASTPTSTNGADRCKSL